MHLKNHVNAARGNIEKDIHLDMPSEAKTAAANTLADMDTDHKTKSDLNMSHAENCKKSILR